MRKTAYCLLLLLVFAGCKRQPRREELVMNFSAEVMQDVLSGMMATVKQQVEAQGYPGAVSFCGTFAPEYGKNKMAEWAQKAQEQLGATSFRFRRVSLQNRNPNNRPDERQAEIIESWQRVKQPLPVGYEQNGVITTVQPIRIVSPLCLGCHGKGSDIAPDTLAEIRKRYPDDKAIGYSLNDLRGAFITEISFP